MGWKIWWKYTGVGMLIASVLLGSAAQCAAQSPVRVLRPEGLVHGFLVLRTLEGEVLADGDVTQLPRGDRITSHAIFRFKDGSVHEETVVFSQNRDFRMISEHLVEKGPAFKQPMDVTINGSTGQTTVRYTDGDGQEKIVTERLKLPPDVSNGMLLTLLKNIRSDVPETTVSMVATAPKPRLVKLVITPEGEESLSVGASNYKATRYVVKVQIGGVAGLLAPVVGKQPQDTRIWILKGEAPVFVKLEGPLFAGGPTWRIEQVCPGWTERNASGRP